MKGFYAFTLLLLVSLSWAQVKFGKVEKEDFITTQSNISPESPAEIISKVGYEVESIPEDLKVLMSKDAGGYGISFEQVNDLITIKSILNVNYSVLPASYYKEIKELFQKIVEIENEQIILQKK